MATPQITPISARAVLGCCCPHFFSARCRIFCGGRFRPSRPPKIGGGGAAAPDPPPYATYGAHFSVYQDFLWQVVKKEKWRRERMPRKLDQTKKNHLGTFELSSIQQHSVEKYNTQLLAQIMNCSWPPLDPRLCRRQTFWRNGGFCNGACLPAWRHHLPHP